MISLRRILLCLCACCLAGARLLADLPELGAGGPREALTLATGWRTFAGAAEAANPSGFTGDAFDDRPWREVEVPHNWDAYAGYRQEKHGNLHGSAWYRVRFDLRRPGRPDHRVFLFFEGVGSHATVWLNGRLLGTHAGGLTTFTLDATEAIRFDRPNLLAVRADHPAGIRDLPWVCGGCERAYGFSEGSQPFGIFRPVHVLVTGSVRITPFGVHLWNDRDVARTRTVHAEVELKNFGPSARSVRIRMRLLDPAGRPIAEANAGRLLAPGETQTVRLNDLHAPEARLWSLADPRLYTARAEIIEGGSGVIDRVDTPFGLRALDWPSPDGSGRGTFLLNGAATFLQGTCEYSHLLGGSHAFTAAQIRARVRQIEAAGFNAFRDAHHPHNLRYQAYWDADGLAWWPQFGAHIWFDRADFRTRYLALLRDWVKERRNSPSLVLWGLQNESQLPEDFAREAAAAIRELDPTAVDQRRITTCNGGSGTDWDVPQNWSGTYGGDPSHYADELRQQRLVGEYGAWRSIDLHEPPGERVENGFSEEASNRLLETKLRLADSVRSEVAGHFHWLFATHDNPGRTFGAKGEQLTDGWSLLDRLGPANNKGLLTLWGEPLDAYYLFRSHNLPASTHPMVVLAGSTSPDRWAGAPVADDIVAYSNADEVELFNDLDGASLGVRHRNAEGHFRWDGVKLRWNLLRAVARQGGRVVASDAILLHHLPESPAAREQRTNQPDTTGAAAGWDYLYRVNCGGPDLKDGHGQLWRADHDLAAGDRWGCVSWAADYPELDPALGSVRRVNVPVSGTRDPALYRTFRYGRQALSYRFSVPDGHYRVELHLVEPWYGRAGVDAAGWRLFDIAINGRTVAREVDLWRESGFAHAQRKVFETDVRGGTLDLSFPRVASYQAVISAIAIARATAPASGAPTPAPSVDRGENARLISGLSSDHGATQQGWLNTGDHLHPDSDRTISRLPESLRHAPWLQRRDGPGGELSFTLGSDADVIAVLPAHEPPAWASDWESTGETLETVGGGNGIERHALLRRHESAAATVRFSPAPEAVVVLAQRPLAAPQAIRDLVVSGSTGPGTWRAAGNLRRGDRPHGPDGPALLELPADLVGSDWLISPESDASNDLRVSFRADDHVDVYVALDRRVAAPPSWLSDWEPVSGNVRLGADAYRLFRRHFDQGDSVVLGPNGSASAGSAAPLYNVVVKLTRPATTYPIDTGQPTRFLDARQPAHRWTIAVGVGDRYRLGFRLHSAEKGPSRLRYELKDRNGQLLCSEESEIDGPAWRTWRLRTCTSINAGTYFVTLTHLSGPAVELQSLTVE